MSNTNMVIDPPSDLNGFIQGWLNAQWEYQTDHAQLVAMISQMLALAKSGKVGEAFQIAQMGVMPGAMQLQGDQMRELAASMNIASAMQEFTTAAQNAMNAGGKMTDPQGDDFVKLIKEFFAEINATPPPVWLNADTKKALNDAINKICEVFKCTGPNDPHFIGATISADIRYWSNNPTSNTGADGVVNPDGKTGQQCLQDLQSGFTQWNNTEAAQSQVLQSQEQFAGNVFNQYMNTCAGIFQAEQKQSQTMVQNQRSQ